MTPECGLLPGGSGSMNLCRMPRQIIRNLEHIQKLWSVPLRPLRGSGVFDFWRRFGPVTGRCGHAPAPKPCHKPKTLPMNRALTSPRPSPLPWKGSGEGGESTASRVKARNSFRRIPDPHRPIISINALLAALPPFWLGLASVALLFSVSIASAHLLEETQNDFRHGKYESVAAAAQKKVAAGDYQEGWRILLVKSLLTLGRYQEAQTNAQAGLDNYSGRLELRLLTREADLFQNDVAGANRQLTEIKLLIEQRGLIDRSGDNLVPLGNALLLLGVEPRLVLENCFQRAEQLDPPLREAFIASGQLALDKHDFKLAADAFRAGLKKFPEDPDMEAGLAKSFASNDGDEMKKALEAALAINPRHIPS